MWKPTLSAHCTGTTSTGKQCRGMVEEFPEFDIFKCKYCFRRYSLDEVLFMTTIDAATAEQDAIKKENAKKRTKAHAQELRVMGNR